MSTDHHYRLTVGWTGNLGRGTADHRAYSRNHEVHADNHQPISGSSDAAFLGDPYRWNPEELLLAAVSQCHMLWYLSLASAAGVVVTDYVDNATGLMREDETGAGQFTNITLYPLVTIVDPAKRDLATELHAQVGANCFIARSVNFPIHHRATVIC